MFLVRLKHQLDQVSNLGLVSWTSAILGLWFSLLHIREQKKKISIGYINFPNLLVAYILSKIEDEIIIKTIINSYVLYSVTLKEVKKSSL